MKILEIENEFKKFRKIYNRREQYNLSWAFKDAQDKVDELYKTIRRSPLEVDDSDFKEIILSKTDMSRIEKFTMKFMNRNKWFTRIFENIYSIITVFEVAVSVALVLILSEISHGFGMYFESGIMSYMVAVFFAFSKVVLEQRYIRPSIEEWGWKLYRNSTNRFHAILNDVVDSFYQVSYNGRKVKNSISPSNLAEQA